MSAIKAQSEPVTAPDTDEASKAVDILQASIAGFFTRQRTKLKEAKKDIKVGSHITGVQFAWVMGFKSGKKINVITAKREIKLWLCYTLLHLQCSPLITHLVIKWIWI